MTFDELLTALSVSDDASSIRLANGARFIRKLPGKGVLAYLHKLYAPLSVEQVSWMEHRLSTQVSGEFAAFLTKANGVSLFASTFLLFGHDDEEQVSRSLELEDQKAMSIGWENDLLRASEPGAWSQGWRVAGALSGWTTQLQLRVHSDGRCQLQSGDGAVRRFDSFGAFMAEVVPRYASCFTYEGPAGETYEQLEAVVSALVQRH